MNRQALQMNTDNYKAGEQTGEADGQKALQTHSQGRYTVKACGQTGNGQGRWTEGTVDIVKADTQTRHVDRQAMDTVDGQTARHASVCVCV